MKKLLLFGGLLGLISCSTPTEKGPATTKPAGVALSVATMSVHQPLSIGPVDTVDHFFYTNQDYKRVGEVNQLDMFRLDATGVLSVCGKEVGHLQYKLGETVESFLAQNLTGTANLQLGMVRIVDWSSDLRGEDDQFFFFKQGKLKKVRRQNALDLAQLRATW